MLETTIPEINVSDLMEQVRLKAAEIERIKAAAVRPFAPLERVELPPLAVVPAQPPLLLPKPPPPRKERILARIGQAREAIVVRKWIPKPIRGLFRKQEGYNNALLDSVTSLAKANGELTGRVEHLTACLDVQQHSLAQLHTRSRDDYAWMEAAGRFLDSAYGQIHHVRREAAEQLAATNARLAEGLAALQLNRGSLEKHIREFKEASNRDRSDRSTLRTRVDAIAGQVQSLQQESEAMAGRLVILQKETQQVSEGGHALQARVEEVWNGFSDLRRDGELSSEHLSNLQKESDRDRARIGEHLKNLQTVHDRNTMELDKVATLQSDLARVGEHLRNLQNLHDRSEGELERVATGALELQRTIAALDERQVSEGAYFRMELSQQASLLRHWFARRGLKSNQKLPVSRTETDADKPGRLDAFYVSFEDRFRGPREEIKKRVEIYLPLIRKARAGTKSAPVLDVGCGRGEWLELLKGKKLQASGVDVNSAMLAQCRERKLKVVHADAVAHLRALRPGSVGAVTGFHIIEHLELEILMDLLAETVRVLRPGGVAIFESPNCKNLVVGATNFNIDPTHRNPIFPETAQFMMRMHGFEKVELKYLTPVEAERFAGTDAQSVVLNDLLYGPQDFAVIGNKPASS